MPILSPPILFHLQRVAALEDRVLRNLLITQCYHELALALRTHTGAGANWCAFATWASRQAGRTIRGEDLREALRARLFASETVRSLAAAIPWPASRPADPLATLVGHVVHALDAEAALERAASAVAVGNRKVFAEIAPAFALFLDVLGDANPDDAFARFQESLRPGEPPAGQQPLRDAFVAYREALATLDPGARAQLLCYANLLVGLHEQTRLQPEIRQALNASFDAEVARRRIVARILPGFWRSVRHRIAALFGRRPPLDDLVDRLLAVVQRELRELITANAMTLELPAGVTLRLGRDFPGTPADSLIRITEPRLTALLVRLDPAPDTLAGSGASDWSELSERLHLIAELFRCHHEWEPLFEAPYSDTQVDSLRADRLPAPPL
jgi:hypothetical protein